MVKSEAVNVAYKKGGHTIQMANDRPVYILLTNC